VANPAKGFQNRCKGVIKKANMLSKLSSAHMAVLCEYDIEYSASQRQMGLLPLRPLQF
jgi:hypothetical protein